MTYDSWKLQTPDWYEEPEITCPHGRSDNDCPTCDEEQLDANTIEALSTLAHNLAVAAGLCRAFELGQDHYEQGGYDDENWSPGCKRSAP